MRDGPQQVNRSLSSHRLTRTKISTFFEPDKSGSIEAVMSRKWNREAAESAQVDGDKKEMGEYKSNARMDDMPIDWVEQVISFLPLADVYKCKSVCMAWKVAADRVLSDWETLVIVRSDIKTRPADKDHIFMPGDAEKWIERTKQLVRLKKLFVNGTDFRSNLRAVVQELVIRNASTLTLLRMRSELLPFDPNRPVVFSNLRDLEWILIG